MRPVRLLLGLVLFGGTAFASLHAWLGVGGSNLDEFAGGWLFDSVVLAAGVACLLRASGVERERRAWLLIGVAILCWGAGEVYWTLFILDDPAPPFPSPADAFYLAFYPLAYAGLALLVRARADELDWRLWADATIAALGTAALGAAFVFDFVVGRTDGTTLEVATALAYPLGDIAMFAMIVGVVALNGWRADRTWGLLLAGLAAQAFADVAYTLQSTAGFAPPGNWVEPIYLISAACLGALLWQPVAAGIQGAQRLDDRRELAVPAFFAAVMIGLAAMQYVGGSSGFSTALWVATMAVVVARLATSARQNRLLFEQVRTDSLTGLGSRGSLEADLPPLLDRASEERPVLILLFDLNGFKHYNDTFGHPAGDELLSRFGERLQEGLGADGAAYRIGGDEFCVLLACPWERFDAVTQAAAQALTARGAGYDVSASWGAAEVPGEETEASAALQLADVRMYAQKESRRVARPEPLTAAPALHEPTAR